MASCSKLKTGFKWKIGIWENLHQLYIEGRICDNDESKHIKRGNWVPSKSHFTKRIIVKMSDCIFVNESTNKLEGKNVKTPELHMGNPAQKLLTLGSNSPKKFKKMIYSLCMTIAINHRVAHHTQCDRADETRGMAHE